MYKKISIILIVVVILLSLSLTIYAADKVYNWKMASVWSGELRALLDADKYFAERVKILSGGKLNIKVYPAGEICGPNEVLDIVSSGTVESGGVVACYSGGKNSAFDLLCTDQVGFTAEDYLLWIYQGGGLEIYHKLYGDYNTIYFPHNIGHMESGIRSREPIKTLGDLKGKNIRMSGVVQSKILQHFGGNPVSLSISELYEAIRRGTVDGAEVSNPYNDKTANLHEVAKYWLTPGWHQTSTVYGVVFNLDAYNNLPDDLKEVIKSASMETMVEKTTFMVYQDALATEFFIKEGVEINKLTTEEIDEIEEVKHSIQEDLAAKNPDYAMVLKSMIDYQKMFAPYRESASPFLFGRNPKSYPVLPEIK